MSTQSNLIDFDRKTDRIRLCLMCKQYFEDLRSTSVCSNCDQKMKYPPVSRKTMLIRSPPTVNYPPSYGASDFITGNRSSAPRVRGLQRTLCPHCKNFNMVNVTPDRMDYNCSICGTYLRFSNVYWWKTEAERSSSRSVVMQDFFSQLVIGVDTVNPWSNPFSPSL